MGSINFENVANLEKAYQTECMKVTGLRDVLCDVDPFPVRQPPRHRGPSRRRHRRVDGVHVVAQVDRFLHSEQKHIE